MSVRDHIKFQQGHFVRHREYLGREQTLRENQELQKADAVKPLDGLRPFARFPENELQRLAEKGRTDKNAPSWWADLTSPDPATQSRAKIRLVNSADGRQYRVGGTSRKMFHFRNNPLAKG